MSLMDNVIEKDGYSILEGETLAKTHPLKTVFRETYTAEPGDEIGKVGVSKDRKNIIYVVGSNGGVPENYLNSLGIPANLADEKECIEAGLCLKFTDRVKCFAVSLENLHIANEILKAQKSSPVQQAFLDNVEKEFIAHDLIKQ